MNTHLQRLIDQAATLLSGADSVAILTGAGASAESGIATFRDTKTGLWTRFNAQQLASQDGFEADPGLVWSWYMHRLLIVEAAQPNPGHLALTALASHTRQLTLITQNIDDLHERAGSQPVLHLHGHIGRFHCNDCGAVYHLQPEDRYSPLPPVCRACNGYIRPDVVWFGEALPGQVLEEARRAAELCDVFLVVGTSGVVYPAAQLPMIARRHGAQIIDVNTELSALSEIADIVLHGPSGEILPAIVDTLQSRRA